MSRLVRASPRIVGDRADDEHRRVDPALQQRAGDDEAVAAVVAAAAEHRHPAVEVRLVGGFDRGHHLAAGVLHQHRVKGCRSLRWCGGRHRASARR